VSSGGLPRRSSSGVHGRRTPVDLPAAGVRLVSEAPRRWSAHGLHEAEATRRHSGRLQRRTGARPSWTRSHPTGRQSVQADLTERVRHTIRRLHKLKVSLDSYIEPRNYIKNKHNK